MTASPVPALRGLDLDQVLGCLSRHAHNPSSYLTLNDGNSYFSVPELDGVIAYRPSGRFLVQLGGVFAEVAHRDRLLARFLEFAREADRQVIAIQLLGDDVQEYLTHGFTVNQLGASYARSLSGFSLSGKRYVRLRNKISRARRTGVEVREILRDRTPELMGQLDAIDRGWLKGKGIGVAELSFLVGQRGGAAEAGRRLFVAYQHDTIVAYHTFSPVFGRHAGWLHDLSRRTADAPPGVSELIIHTAVEKFVGEGAGHLHFGLTPFTGIDTRHRLPGHSPLGDRIVHWLAEHGEFVYPAKSQAAYKEKWQPDLIQPEYVAFQQGLRLAAVWRLLRMTNAVSFRLPGSVRTGPVGRP
jgi:lysylphosphatidylglycerol synthetase-like protein (DUF2156 family)